MYNKVNLNAYKKRASDSKRSAKPFKIRLMVKIPTLTNRRFTHSLIFCE